MKMNWLRKTMPIILSALGAVGVVGTAVLAAKAAPEAQEKIKAKSREEHDGDPDACTPVEAVQACWKDYIPTAVTGAATILCIVGSNAISMKNQAAIIGAYATLDKVHKSYRDAAKEVYGEDADSKIKAVAAKKMYLSGETFISSCHVYDPDEDDSEKVLFYDANSGQYFNSTLPAVINAQYHLNRNLMLYSWVTVNEFCDLLGIPHVKNGDKLGWDMCRMYEDEIVWMDFDNQMTKLDDGLRCYVITSAITPEEYTEDY